MDAGPRITIIQGGPYRVEGDVALSQDAMVLNERDDAMEYRHVCDYAVRDRNGYLLCRCGHSKTMPFCDGSHVRIGFKGAEVASREPYVDRVEQWEGPELILLDDNRCAYARFCHRLHSEVWTLTEEASSDYVKRNAIAAAWECPTGRLTSYDRRTQQPYEQDFEPSIVVLEDVGERASGPLFVRGGIPLIGADGFEYETRNRYALCRCGCSRDMPFCDASHVSYRFYDGSESFEGDYGHRDRSIEELPDLERPHSAKGVNRMDRPFDSPEDDR